MVKALVTGGCSFSECESEWIDTWPRHLANRLDVSHYSLGKGSVGNGYISRAVIYQTNELLKTYNANDILVAIMWTSWDRIDLRLPVLDDIPHQDAETEYNIRKGSDWPNYPVKWQDLSTVVQQEIETSFPNLKLLLLNPLHNVRRGFLDKSYWTNISMLLDIEKYRNLYFSLFEDNVSKQIYSYEHILRTQWFLQKHNVKSIMMKMSDSVTDFKIVKETEHLRDMIDWSVFLDCSGMIEWTMEKYGKSGFPKFPDLHPGTEQHRAFTEEVICKAF